MSIKVGLRRALLAALLCSSALLVSSCADDAPVRSTSAARDDSITVASFNFSESTLLAEIYAQALGAAGFPVERQLGLGAREIVQPALQQGMVDLVPEYVGSALTFLVPGEPAVTGPEEGRERLQAAYGDHAIIVLEPAPAQNQNVFVVLRETAGALGLATLGDLRPFAGDLVFGGPPECPRRWLCLAGLEEVYGIEFGGVEALDSGGPLTVAALHSGRVDVALLFATSGSLAGDDLVPLVDDRGLQPAENLVPVLRQAVVDRHGEGVVRVIDAVTERLDETTLVGLGLRLDRGEAPAAVAAGWLASQGLD